MADHQSASPSETALLPKPGEKRSTGVGHFYFGDQRPGWSRITSALTVEVDGQSDARGVQVVHVHFLMPSAPVEWLTSGRKFTLQEGRTQIAEGEIL
jgi:hypothetical protein